MMPKREKRTLHFDLAHLDPGVAYTLHAGAAEVSLVSHDEVSRAEARAGSPGLGLVPEDRITHWAEVELPAENVMLIWVTCRSRVEGAQLDTMVLSQVYVPPGARRNAWQRISAQQTKPHPKLEWYGVDATSGAAEATELDDLSSPMEAAMAVIFMHSEMANLDPETAAAVLNHIYYANGIGDLATSIQEQAEQHQVEPYKPNWVIEANWRDLDGQVVESITIPDPATRQPYTIDSPRRYAYSPETREWAKGVMVSALVSTKNDPDLQSTSSRPGCYSVKSGTPVVPRADPSAMAQERAQETAQATTAGDAGWTVTPSSRVGGMQVSSDVSFDGDQLAVDLTNWFLRWLSVSARFYGPNGELLTVDDWTEVSPMDSSALSGVYEDGTTKYLGMIGSVNTIMGVPLEAQPSTLNVEWPESASSASLLIGSLGMLRGPANSYPPYTGGWDPKVCVPGFGMTATFNLGIPMIFLVAGVLVDESEMKEVAKLVTADVLAAVNGLVNLTAAAVTGNASPQTLLTILINTLLPIVLSSSLALAAWVAEKVTVAVLEKSIPVVGWILEGVTFVADITTIVEATTEIFLAPALYSVDITRTMDIEVTVEPDPDHQGQWPSTATHYQVKAIYSDGKVYLVEGRMDATTQTGPITVSFEGVPAGGWVRFIASFYSETDWLAGQAVWPNSGTVSQQNGSVQSLPTDDGDLMQVPSPADSVQFAIKENLVPLEADTYYHPKEELVFQGGERQWASDTFTLQSDVQELIDDLDAQNLSALQPTFATQGFPLSNATTITVIESGRLWLLVDPDGKSGAMAYHVGYLTSADGSVSELEVDPANAETLEALSGSNVGANLGALIGIRFCQETSSVGYTWQGSDQGLADCGGSSVDTGLVYTFQNLSEGSDPQSALRFVSCGLTMPQPYLLYDLNGPASGDGYNFYLDPRDGADDSYCLRKVILDQESGTFDLEPSGDCWGRFCEPLDSMVIHPSGYVVGINTANSRLEILKIPSQGSSVDSEAPAALVLAGAGDRVGLLHQPVAVTATSDGRILVLEGESSTGAPARVQAMDTGGNPVCCFDGEGCPSSDGGGESGSSSAMALRDEGTAVTYLDLGVETKGYIYVLKYLDDGNQVEDYRLDIYDPRGNFVCQTQGLNAARIVIDMWRNLLSVNFRNLFDQSGRTEPSISEWIPSTPEG